jgi:hypothetical protein
LDDKAYHTTIFDIFQSVLKESAHTSLEMGNRIWTYFIPVVRDNIIYVGNNLIVVVRDSIIFAIADNLIVVVRDNLIVGRVRDAPSTGCLELKTACTA